MPLNTQGGTTLHKTLAFLLQQYIKMETKVEKELNIALSLSEEQSPTFHYILPLLPWPHLEESDSEDSVA